MIRNTLITNSYPSMILHLASVQINFDWASEGASQLDLAQKHLILNAPKRLKEILEPLCGQLVQTLPDKCKIVVLLIP